MNVDGTESVSGGKAQRMSRLLGGVRSGQLFEATLVKMFRVLHHPVVSCTNDFNIPRMLKFRHIASHYKE